MLSFFSRTRKGCSGYTLVELLTVVTVIGAVSTIAIPSFNSYYEKCCLMSAISEITGMIKEAKPNALCDEKYYAISFNPVLGKVSLLSGRGADGTWNTDDDQVVRSFRLVDKGGGLRFGHGDYGPLPAPNSPNSTLAVAPDGISFQNNNTLICNPELTGTAGVAYLISGRGSAMAIKMNSTDYGYTLWKWHGNVWKRI